MRVVNARDRAYEAVKEIEISKNVRGKSEGAENSRPILQIERESKHEHENTKSSGIDLTVSVCVCANKKACK